MIEQFPIKCFVLRCIEQALPWNPGVIEQRTFHSTLLQILDSSLSSQGKKILFGVVQTTVAVLLSGCVTLDNLLIHSRNNHGVAALHQALCQVLRIK